MTILTGATSFDRVRALFDEAAARRPTVYREAHFRFAGDAVRIRVVGDALASRVFRPFVHLACDRAQRTVLTIDMWDEDATGVAYRCDESAGDSDGQWRAAGGYVTAFNQGRVLRYEQHDAVTWLDRGSGHMVGWRRKGVRLPLHEQSKPFPLLLTVWHHDRGRSVVHSGLIADGGQAVLVGGASCRGKSTTTLAAVTHGAFAFLGDDQTALRPAENNQFVGHSLYQSARLDAAHLTRFPMLSDRAIGVDEPQEKRLIFMKEIERLQVRSEAAIRAIVLPSIDPSTVSRVRTATKAETLLRIAPTSVFAPFGPGRLGFQILSKLIERVPSYSLTLGHDLDQVPAHLHAVLREAA